MSYMSRDDVHAILSRCKGKSLMDFGVLVAEEAARRALGAGPVCGGNPLGLDGDLVGCGKPIESQADVYRCTDCDVPFHRTCAIRHFATDTAERSQEAFAEQLRRIEASAATVEGEPAQAVPAGQPQPLYWECRGYDHEAGRWGEWGRVQGHKHYPLAQRLDDIREQIAKGKKWELRALYASPPAGTAAVSDEMVERATAVFLASFGKGEVAEVGIRAALRVALSAEENQP